MPKIASPFVSLVRERLVTKWAIGFKIDHLRFNNICWIRCNSSLHGSTWSIASQILSQELAKLVAECAIAALLLPLQVLGGISNADFCNATLLASKRPRHICVFQHTQIFSTVLASGYLVACQSLLDFLFVAET